MFQLTGNLIDGKNAYAWLIDNSAHVNGRVSICSAFLRSSVIKDLSIKFQGVESVRVMVRWQLGDLLAGASDLLSYKYCSDLRWKFHICLNFHGKVFHLPTSGILVGSANATEAGFGLRSYSNSETCTVVKETDSNIEFIDKLFNNSIELNDELFFKIEKAVNDSVRNSNLLEWPDYLIHDLTFADVPEKKLFLSECFKSNGQEVLTSLTDISDDARSDLSLLGISRQNIDLDFIARQFKKTKLFFLLKSLLNEKGGEVYFGALTAALHDWLIEDPAPHRREVKVLVKNIFGWVRGLGPNVIGLIVDRPNHSERIRSI